MQIYCDVYVFLVRIITSWFKMFDVMYSLCVCMHLDCVVSGKAETFACYNFGKLH